MGKKNMLSTKLIKYKVKYFGVIILILLISSCQKHSNKINNDLNVSKLNGPVKSLLEIDYSKSGEYKTYISYNIKGNVFEQSSFNPDGSLIKKWEYSYNNLNQKISRSCYVLKDSLSGISHYKYNTNGKITEEALFDAAAGLVSKLENRFDKNQNLIEQIFSTLKNKILGSIIYKYDKKNKLIEELQSDSVQHKNIKISYTYSRDGLNEEILYKAHKDSLIKRSTFFYLSHKLVGVDCEYDTKNKIISKTLFEYDKYDNVIKQQIKDFPQNSIETHVFNYTYDKYKNWTFRYEYVNGKLFDIIARKFDYYMSDRK